MDAASSIAPPSATTGGGGVGGTTNNSSNNNPPAASTAQQHQPPPPKLIARTPLNAYLKIAIIRNPTDEVVCNDPEFPGTKKRVVVSELMDGSLTKVGTTKQEEEPKNNNNEEAKKTTAATTTTSNNETSTATTSSLPKKNDKKEKEEGPKKEIPVPTITTVPTYELDIPPTYNIPTSYVRYIRPTYHETQNETVEYNIDIEDETWWRNNTEFGPDATCKILIDGKEQLQMKKEEEEGGGQKNNVVASNDKNDSNAMDIDNNNNQDNTKTHKQYTIQEVILTNPKYYLHSKSSFLF